MRGGIPNKKSYEYYVVKLLEIEKGSLGKRVLILATTAKDNTLGIPHTIFDWRTQCFSPVEHQKIVFTTNTKVKDDCMNIRKFSETIIPLCLTWNYCSDELKSLLKSE